MNREKYQKLKQGKESRSMTLERIELLNRINFAWDPRDEMWYERLEELEEFTQTNGLGIMPPRKTHAVLVDWLRYQRKLYRAKLDGKKVTLTDKRIAELKRLGFVFD